MFGSYLYLKGGKTSIRIAFEIIFIVQNSFNWNLNGLDINNLSQYFTTI